MSSIPVNYYGPLTDWMIKSSHIIEGLWDTHLNPMGYDLTLGQVFKIPKSEMEIDTAMPEVTYQTLDRAPEGVRVPPGSFILGHSVEKIHMPDDVIAFCYGRSSGLRIGLNVSMTPLEPGWQGHVTIELFNSAHYPLRVYPGQRVAQVCFLRGMMPADNYVSKGGRYQNQVGPVESKGLN